MSVSVSCEPFFTSPSCFWLPSRVQALASTVQTQQSSHKPLFLALRYAVLIAQPPLEGFQSEGGIKQAAFTELSLFVFDHYNSQRLRHLFERQSFQYRPKRPV